MSHSAAGADAVITAHLAEILKLPEQEILPQLPRLLRLLSDVQLPLSEKQSALDTTSHAICTKIGSLLAGHSNAGRWIAVVAIQTVLGRATFNVVETPAAWVRGLIALLNKPCTPSTKISAMASFTKMAILARPHATFMRETITPNLPQYLNGCHGLIVFPNSQCRLAALDSLARLVPVHPTVFRPLENKLYSVLRPMIMGATRLDGTAVSADEPEIAARLWVRLHFAAPKGQSGSAWEARVYDCIEAVHKLFDLCFRGLVEDWAGSKTVSSKAKATGDLTLLSAASAVSSISLASETAVCLLNLLESYMKAPTAAVVSIPVGFMTELCIRALLVSLSSEGSKTRNFGRQQIPNSVRDPVCIAVCDIQVAALRLIRCIAETTGPQFLPFLHDGVQSIGWSFGFGNFWHRKRIPTYEVTAVLLRIGGPTLEKLHMKSLTPIFRECCNDVLPLRRETPKTTGGNAKQRTNMQADFILGASVETFDSPELRGAASALLPLIFSHTPESLLPFSIRAAADKAAVLSQNKEAMLNSVLYPPAQGDRAHPRASIMPHLVGSFPGDSEVEGLVRPRMPALLYDQPLTNGAGHVESDEEMDEGSAVADSDRRLEKQALKRSMSTSPPPALPSPKRARNAPAVPPREAQPAERHLETLAAAVSAQDLNSPSPTPYTNPFTRSDAPPPETRLGPATIPYTSNTTADAEESSDDDFSVPELTIGADTEDEDEIP